jgi:CheY-like chemotaxis protein
MLKQHGAEVTSASSAADAYRLFNEQLPDVLISDIGMPEQDGYELMRRIRELPVEKGGAIPALALTGYATRKDRDLSFSAGYHRHIAKPIEQGELVAAIASLVGDQIQVIDTVCLASLSESVLTAFIFPPAHN